MKLISLNVEFNKHLESIFPFLEKERPDIFCAQEILEEDIPKFKKVLGDYEVIFKPWSWITYGEIYPDQFGKKQGIAIFANKINSSGFSYYLGNENNTDISFEEYLASPKETRTSKVVAWIETADTNKSIYKIATTHLPVTEKGESTPAQLNAAKRMLSSIEQFKDVILCGDMNAPRGNPTFALLNERYTDNIPAEYKTSMDQNLHRVPGLIYMVDCLFTTPEYKADTVKLVDGVSDHMAIVAEITKI